MERKVVKEVREEGRTEERVDLWMEVLGVVAAVVDYI